jgi:predicted Zn finger-like uncharacterized protein
MVVKLRCDECGKSYTVKSEFAGKTIRCKSCSHPITVPEEQQEFSESEPDGFFDSLSEAVDHSFNASALPPKTSGARKSLKTQSKNTNRGNWVSGHGVAEYAYAVSLFLGLVLSLLILNYHVGFFAFFVFFGGICLAAAFSKTEPENRWSIPAVGVIAGYTIMMLFAAVVTRNTAVAVDLIVMGIGLVVFVNSPGVLGLSILAGLFLLQLMYLSGALGGVDILVMDQDIRRCHLLAAATCMIYLVAGYLYHVCTTRFLHSA